MDAMEYDDALTRAGAQINALQENERRLCDELLALRKALSFYADPTRYHGPNQRLDEPDEWSASVGLGAYRLDVTRDQGVIARTVLGAA